MLVCISVAGCEDPVFLECDGGTLVLERGERVCLRHDAGVRDGGAPDVGMPDAGVGCGILPQRGCAPDQACGVYGVGELVCRPAGDGEAGGACPGGYADCASGYDCLAHATADGTTAHVCRTQCAVHAGCPEEGLCEYPIDELTWHCTVPCDPVTNEGCGERLVCGLAVHGARPWNTTDCFPHPASAPAGGACRFDFECPLGYGCREERCERWCWTDADCDDGSCIYDELGVLGPARDRRIGHCSS